MSSILTNGALVYEPNCGGGGEGYGVSVNEHSCAHGAQIIFGDLTPYLTYGPSLLLSTVIYTNIIHSLSGECKAGRSSSPGPTPATHSIAVQSVAEARVSALICVLPA
jgi:hypothetical protein